MKGCHLPPPPPIPFPISLLSPDIISRSLLRKLAKGQSMVTVAHGAIGDSRPTSEGPKMGGHSPPEVQSPSLSCVWEATVERRWNVILRPLPPLVLASKIFFSAPFSRYYPLFPTKVPGLLACIPVQLDPCQMEPYFDVTIPNSYSWQKILFNSI